jgi:hypothetical protein
MDSKDKAAGLCLCASNPDKPYYKFKNNDQMHVGPRPSLQTARIRRKSNKQVLHIDLSVLILSF